MTDQKQQFQRQMQKAMNGKNEDVDFSAEIADEDDLEAAERANQADARQEQTLNKER